MAPSVSDAWRVGHPWAVAYRRLSTNPWIARPVGRLGFGLDVDELRRPLDLVAALPDGASVLDAPCGPGDALSALTPTRRLRWTSGDIAPAMLRQTEREARRRGLSQVCVREADLLDLPFADASFDLCLSLLGLHCVPDPARAVAELARVLRPGGALAGTVFVTGAGLRYLPAVVGGRALGILGPSGDEADVRAWLTAAGLQITELTVLGTIARFAAVRPA